MSPVGESFRNYCRMFPALINNTTINWFMRWPEDALAEVAEKFLGEMPLPEEHQAGLAKVCSFAHMSCIEKSDRMRQELKRIFYVTPTNYIELLKAYGVLLGEKKRQIGGQIEKLSNGLSKLDEARVLVEEMNTMSETKRIDVQKKTKVTEELVLEISKEQRNADERLKIITQQQAIIKIDTEETMRLAKEADEELAKCLPALEAANRALAQLEKKEIAEIKAYVTPPPIVGKVMEAVMVCLKEGTTWAEAKKVLADPNFMDRLVKYDKDNITPKILAGMEKYTGQPDFDVDFVFTKSAAASKLCSWVRALESYAKSLKIVEPKRERKRYAEEKLAKMQADLQRLEDDYNIIKARLAVLGGTFQETNNEA
jgi:dynein heavy chain